MSKDRYPASPSLYPSPLVVNIEGPYGQPIPYQRLDGPILVAGGIGITLDPFHLTESLQNGSVHHTVPIPLPTVKGIKEMWEHVHHTHATPLPSTEQLHWRQYFLDPCYEREIGPTLSSQPRNPLLSLGVALLESYLNNQSESAGGEGDEF